jgi:hypothetical protein
MHMKKLCEQTRSGSDCLTFYGMDDADTIGVVHFDLWEDMDSSAVETHGKYNVQSGTVALYGFDGRADLGHIGQSVHDALRSCGYVLEVRVGGGWSVKNEHDGEMVALDHATARLVVADALWFYGAKDVACDVSGNNKRALIREAKQAI